MAKSFRQTELKMRSRVARVANQYLYEQTPRLNAGQIQTLAGHPEMMDALVRELGPQMVAVLLGQQVEQPDGLVPE